MDTDQPDREPTIIDELQVLAMQLNVRTFIQKYCEYLKSGVETIDAQWGFSTENLEVLQRLAGEKQSYQKTIKFLEELIRPPKPEGDNEKGEE